MDLGALYHTAITQGWGLEYKAKLADESRKLEKKRQAEQQREENEHKRAKAKQDRDLLRQKAKQKFEMLDIGEKGRLIAEFGETLRGFPLATFKKTGVSSAMLAPTFASWLVGRLKISMGALPT